MTPRTSAPDSRLRPSWLFAAGVVGALAAVLVLRTTSPMPRPDAAMEPDRGAPVRPAAAPVSAAPPPTVQTAGPIDPESATDDASLARRARETYGYDCDAVATRSAVRTGSFEITCTSGVVLRVHALDGAPTRFAPVH